ncbi:MAG: HEPN domain-containing protein [Candidatus Moranbacteria bacterium]|nr:HEPN domain-containing protein [Candidatus Moranbacteria bacterium]
MLSDAEKKYQEWFKKANEDDLSAQSLLRHRDGTASVACFLSQQMAEKYLKGLLVSCASSFPKIHDVKRIASK